VPCWDACKKRRKQTNQAGGCGKGALKELPVEVGEEVEHLTGNRMSKNGAIEVIKVNTLIHSVVTYALQFASFSKNAIRQIDVSIMRLVKSKLKIARSMIASSRGQFWEQD
jgi:hypothetical protein